MMTKRTHEGERWIYGFSLEDRVPSDHSLRKIKSAIDFDFIYDLVQKHYSHTGAPSVDPVVVFKLSLIGYLYNVPSERRLLEEASLNMAYLWFLGYDIDEELPDHSIMTKARLRFGVDAYREFFRRVVEACRKAGLIEGDTLYLDSTLIDSQSANSVVRSKFLVDELKNKTVDFIDELFRDKDDDGDDKGIGNKQKSLPKKVNERFCNPSDPDADIVRRTTGPGRLCYKGHFGVDGGDARIITAVAATGGAIADEHLLLGLLAEHETLSGRPNDLVADQKYGTKTNFRILKVKGIRPAIKPSAGRGPGAGYQKDAFIYDSSKDVYTCPGEKILSKVADVSLTQKTYRSKKADCSKCSLKEKCIPGKKRKSIMRGPGDTIFEWARQFLKTPRGKELIIKRSIWSETIFAEAKRSHGMGKARFRGRWKVEIQVLMTASAINLKKLGRYGPKRAAISNLLDIVCRELIYIGIVSLKKVLLATAPIFD